MMNTPIDFSLHDIVRLRLVDATADEVRLIERQIGPLQVPVAGTPDIQIRFTSEQPRQDELRILGDWDAGYNEEGFWLLRGNHGRSLAVRIPFAEVGNRCEIVCRRPLTNVPLLQSIVNLTVLVRGELPLHASAFQHGSSSILVTGWAKGGKTEALLGFAQHGAHYVGDEWVYISGDGRRMFGLPQPLHLWDWHLDSPQQRARLTARQRLKLTAARLLYQLSRGRWLTSFLGGKTAWRLRDWIYKRRHVSLTPERLFGRAMQMEAECPQQVFFMASHAANEVFVERMPMPELIDRMAVSLEDEFAELMSAYRQFRFAFPQARSKVLDQLPAHLHARLAQVLRGKSAYAVWHPYPVAPQQLFQAMQAYTGTNLVDDSRARITGVTTTCPVA